MLADRGFDIEEELRERNIKWNIPAFLKGREHFEDKELDDSRKVANVRIHIERAVRKVKEFQILSGTVPLTLGPSLENIWIICCHLANFTGNLINPDTLTAPSFEGEVEEDSDEIEEIE